MSEILTAAKVEAILLDCLFKEGEPTEPRIETEGIVRRFGFHPERLKSHESEIAALLAELPDQFKRSVGGGWSFLNACMTKDGDQWGEHQNMEQLFCLGNALGLSKWCLPKSMWSSLPGGMPYVVVEDTPTQPAPTAAPLPKSPA